MWMPALFGESLIDDFFDEFFDDFSGRTRVSAKPESKNPNPAYGSQADQLMRTDIKETEEQYILTVDLPGFKKEDIQVAVENDCLTITAHKGPEKEDVKYLRRERYAGSLRRAFYVGEGVEQEGMKAQFQNGVLRLTLPKQKPQKVVEENKYIAIE
ncbi:MAG: Hsp20/alpha crystallin family protein [Lachnospiraceae bacterium]|nr:Hsp20/alpha crystallin family protein [Lachnospiraceae bacterium]MDE7240077.1 Hsp20/alpha crystallin family protein [Lachnospiraceae bacterium]